VRVLAALTGTPSDAEVIAAVQHLLDADDEVYALVLQRPTSVAATVSSSGGRFAAYPSNIATTTGQLIRSQAVHCLPAESEVQATARVRAELLQTLTARFGHTLIAERIHVRFTHHPAQSILDAARMLRVHGIALADDLAQQTDRHPLVSWFTPDPAQHVLKRAHVPVLIVQRDARIARPSARPVLSSS